jgi:hypothetical protein
VQAATPAAAVPAAAGAVPDGVLALAAAVGNGAFSGLATGRRSGPPGLLRAPKATKTAEEQEEDERRKAEFAGKTFSRPVHEPSIGGRFGISYQPGAGCSR